MTASDGGRAGGVPAPFLRKLTTVRIVSTASGQEPGPPADPLPRHPLRGCRLVVDIGSATGMHRSLVLSGPSGAAAAQPPGFLDEHLCVNPGNRRTAACCAEYADVLAHGAPLPDAQAGPRVRHLLDRYPGCLLAAVPRWEGGCLVGCRGGGLIRALPGGRTGAPLTGRQCSGLTSALHAWLVAGHRLTAVRTAAISCPYRPWLTAVLDLRFTAG
ncbi:hypothetical protein PJ985_19855 [Streptomyces sp. ACA25]|uniref:hypothetical protein n=1 Tax=Streptomyces sp. ACA25 TaxID=3022596 RepID=UPI0023075A0B|nr:hypothetical protein [Streptomyces sp. ACA25]MDB1089815.1 hypothetical protein [Streptomyces sp. ACA25]